MKLARTLVMLVASVGVIAAAQADTVIRDVEYAIDGKPYRGTLVYDGSVKDPRPGVLMVPNWLGVTEQSARKAAIVAGKQYVVLIADVYGADVRPDGPQQAGAVAGALLKDRTELRKRANAAMEILRGKPGDVAIDTERVAAVGFCFGGTTVLEMLRSGEELSAVVSLHGGLGTPSAAGKGDIKAPVLVLNGADDPAVPREHVSAFRQEMQAAEADWQLIDYGNAVHSFTDPTANNPGRNEYNPVVARRAYIAMHSFLNEHFTQPASTQ